MKGSSEHPSAMTAYPVGDLRHCLSLFSLSREAVDGICDRLPDLLPNPWDALVQIDNATMRIYCKADEKDDLCGVEANLVNNEVTTHYPPYPAWLTSLCMNGNVSHEIILAAIYAWHVRKMTVRLTVLFHLNPGASRFVASWAAVIKLTKSKFSATAAEVAAETWCATMTRMMHTVLQEQSNEDSAGNMLTSLLQLGSEKIDNPNVLKTLADILKMTPDEFRAMALGSTGQLVKEIIENGALQIRMPDGSAVHPKYAKEMVEKMTEALRQRSDAGERITPDTVKTVITEVAKSLGDEAIEIRELCPVCHDPRCDSVCIVCNLKRSEADHTECRAMLEKMKDRDSFVGDLFRHRERDDDSDSENPTGTSLGKMN